MQLSAELFRRIVETLSSDEKNCSRHEKRREGRVGLRCSVEVTPSVFDDNGQKTVRVWVRDISPSGMGFVSHDKMDVGVDLICQLPCESGGTTKMVMTVRHCVRLSKGLFNIGVGFKKPALAGAPVAESPTAQLPAGAT